MKLITQVTDDALQQQSLVLDDGSQVLIQMYFRPMQYGWFFNIISYGEFTVQGIRIVNSPNMLYQWMNKLPFGIACISTQNREPSQQQDFSSGASKLYLLSQAECLAYKEFLENGT